MSAPIKSALKLARTALYAALSPLVANYASRPACYWKGATDTLGLVQALTSVPPSLAGAIVYQSQDGGGLQVLSFDAADWTGLITIRCLAGSLQAAETLLDSIPDVLTLPAPTGFTIQSEYIRPLDLPTQDGVYTAAALYRVTLSRI